MSVPQLRNDCFALPPGVDWTPVDEALDRLEAALTPVVISETVATTAALGRILAAPAIAAASHPPYTNAAVDGYAFDHASLGSGPHKLPLAEGRSAAGSPFAGKVPNGHAIRILTGARVPEDTDTIVLEEDTSLDGAHVSFERGLKPRANTRAEGEDITVGATLLPEGHRVTAGDIALLASAGVAEVTAYRPLRVAILSTGDEIRPLGEDRHAGQIPDANRPMLAAILSRWGYEVVDLGHAPDDPTKIRAALDRGALEADAILTSGGASAGDEDHVSALLKGEGTLSSWRIALKPGRPLALALWKGKPVFGLPGNPVAAFVCTLVFARPALSRLAGGTWLQPSPVALPSGFTKSKKPGRSEYLRARIRDGKVEAFHSEGSGRVTGLSWAEGLVVLPPEAMDIEMGDLVPYISFADLGL